MASDYFSAPQFKPERKPSKGGKFKRGDRVEYTYAGGKVVQGVVEGPYGPAEMAKWWRVRLCDEHGEYGGGCHEDQLRKVGNR